MFILCAHSTTYLRFHFCRFCRETAHERHKTDGLTKQPQANLLAYNHVVILRRGDRRGLHGSILGQLEAFISRFSWKTASQLFF